MDLSKSFRDTIVGMKDARSASPDSTDSHRALTANTDNRFITRGEYDHDQDKVLEAFEKMFRWQQQMQGAVTIMKWLVPVLLTVIGVYVEYRHP